MKNDAAYNARMAAMYREIVLKEKPAQAENGFIPLGALLHLEAEREWGTYSEAGSCRTGGGRLTSGFSYRASVKTKRPLSGSPKFLHFGTETRRALAASCPTLSHRTRKSGAPGVSAEKFYEGIIKREAPVVAGGRKISTRRFWHFNS